MGLVTKPDALQERVGQVAAANYPSAEVLASLHVLRGQLLPGPYLVGEQAQVFPQDSPYSGDTASHFLGQKCEDFRGSWEIRSLTSSTRSEVLANRFRPENDEFRLDTLPSLMNFSVIDKMVFLEGAVLT